MLGVFGGGDIGWFFKMLVFCFSLDALELALLNNLTLNSNACGYLLSIAVKSVPLYLYLTYTFKPLVMESIVEY